GYYVVNPKDLTATKIIDSDVKYNASDLAGSALLSQKEKNAANKFDVSNATLRPIAATGDAKVYPNPVSGSSFYVSLSDLGEGRYTVNLTDIAGRVIQTKSVLVANSKHNEQVKIVNRPVKGIYMVQVIDAQNKMVLTEKIIIE
ncbi:MAG: T9SS type A sorting domain-containing protein, partial [Ferruginibacter sp.]